MHVNDLEVMQHLAQQRQHNNLNLGTPAQLPGADSSRISPQNTYGADRKAGQSFSYNPHDKGHTMAETVHLPKSKGGTLV